MQIGRRLQGKVDAADLVQDTFLAAHRDFAQFRGKTEAEFAGWLRRILAAKLTDVVRRYCHSQRRDVRLECQLVDELEQSSQAMESALAAKQSSPSQQAVRREQAVLLADAIKSLPADCAEVIILHHLEGRSFPDVARLMSRSLDSVKKLWVRALSRMRDSLEDSL
jgi:RNA polymerase sigma-70 factor (ECF subfamily)